MPNEMEVYDRDMEVVEQVHATPVGALEAMERAQIDRQIATAKAYPRQITSFHRKAKELATASLEIAEECIYNRPVGRKSGGRMEYATGPSVRLAEIVNATYQHMRVGAQIIEMNPRFVKAVGFAWDLENNTAVQAEVVEPTIKKDGTPYDERMRVVIAKAAQSKAIRDAIFRVVPKAVCAPIIQAVKATIAGDAATFEARRKKALEWAQGLGVTKERVFTALGIKGEQDLDTDRLLTLTGIKTAIESGDVTPDEAFPPVNGTPDKAAPRRGVEAAKEAVKRQTRPAKSKDSGALFDASQQPPRYVCGDCQQDFAAPGPDGNCPFCQSAEVIDRTG